MPKKAAKKQYFFDAGVYDVDAIIPFLNDDGLIDGGDLAALAVKESDPKNERTSPHTLFLLSHFVQLFCGLYCRLDQGLATGPSA